MVDGCIGRWITTGQVVLQRDGPLGVHGVDPWRRRSSEPDGDSSEEPEECTEHGAVGRLVPDDADDEGELVVDADDEKEPETEEQAEREWQRELQRLRTSDYASDRSISALFDRRWGESIDKDTLVKHIINDAVYGTIFKILAEKADVLRIVVPRLYLEDLLRGVYSLKNGLLYHRRSSTEYSALDM